MASDCPTCRSKTLGQGDCQHSAALERPSRRGSVEAWEQATDGAKYRLLARLLHLAGDNELVQDRVGLLEIEDPAGWALSEEERVSGRARGRAAGAGGVRGGSGEAYKSSSAT